MPQLKSSSLHLFKPQTFFDEGTKVVFIQAMTVRNGSKFGALPRQSKIIFWTKDCGKFQPENFWF